MNSQSINLDKYTAAFDRRCDICGRYTTGSREDVIDHRSRCMATVVRALFEEQRRRELERQEQLRLERERREQERRDAARRN